MNLLDPNAKAADAAEGTTEQATAEAPLTTAQDTVEETGEAVAAE